jgi:hypothetical protein
MEIELPIATQSRYTNSTLGHHNRKVQSNIQDLLSDRLVSDRQKIYRNFHKSRNSFSSTIQSRDYQQSDGFQ